MIGDKSLPAIVYIARNLLNGKLYVGVTRQTLAQRRSQHRSSARLNRCQGAFHRAIRKYGIEMFRFSVVKRCVTAFDALAEERRLIALWQPAYNSTLGGEGQLGRGMSEAGRARLSAFHKGKQWHLGHRHDDATREMLRRLGFRDRAKWAERAHLGPQSQCKPVICLDDGVVHESASAAARAYGAARSAIIELCLGQRGRKTVAGRRFAYAGAPS